MDRSVVRRRIQLQNVSEQRIKIHVFERVRYGVLLEVRPDRVEDGPHSRISIIVTMNSEGRRRIVFGLFWKSLKVSFKLFVITSVPNFGNLVSYQ